MRTQCNWKVKQVWCVCGCNQNVFTGSPDLTLVVLLSSFVICLCSVWLSSECFWHDTFIYHVFTALHKIFGFLMFNYQRKKKKKYCMKRQNEVLLKIDELVFLNVNFLILRLCSWTHRFCVSFCCCILLYHGHLDRDSFSLC